MWMIYEQDYIRDEPNMTIIGFPGPRGILQHHVSRPDNGLGSWYEINHKGRLYHIFHTTCYAKWRDKIQGPCYPINLYDEEFGNTGEELIKTGRKIVSTQDIERLFE